MVAPGGGGSNAPTLPATEGSRIVYADPPRSPPSPLPRRVDGPDDRPRPCAPRGDARPTRRRAPQRRAHHHRRPGLRRRGRVRRHRPPHAEHRPARARGCALHRLLRQRHHLLAHARRAHHGALSAALRRGAAAVGRRGDAGRRGARPRRVALFAAAPAQGRRLRHGARGQVAPRVHRRAEPAGAWVRLLLRPQERLSRLLAAQ